MKNLGKNGIIIEQNKPKNLNQNNIVIERNSIHDYAQLIWTKRAAISVEGVGIKISNNTIYNSPSSGIIFIGNDIKITHNEVYNTCYGNVDIGAIATYAVQFASFGNKINHNHIHDIPSLKLQGSMGGGISMEWRVATR